MQIIIKRGTNACSFALSNGRAIVLQPEPVMNEVADEDFGRLLKEYGAFVELEPGLDGLVHISEVANKRVSNIADELEIGQEVEAKILDIDTERKRISLSLKQVDKADEDAAGEPDEEEIADITAEEAETADAEPEAAEESAEAAEEAEEK